MKLASVLLILIVAINLQFAYAETKFVSISQGSSSSGSGCQDVPNCYDPFEVTIIQGDSVKWTNDDTAAHTVTSGDSMGPDGIFDSSFIFAGNMFTHTFDLEPPDDYTYLCLIHPWMRGIVHLLPGIAVGGELISLDATALLLGYTILNSYWIAPTAVGIGLGIYLVKRKID